MEREEAKLKVIREISKTLDGRRKVARASVVEFESDPNLTIETFKKSLLPDMKGEYNDLLSRLLSELAIKYSLKGDEETLKKYFSLINSNFCDN